MDRALTLAHDIERQLGDPRDPALLFSYAQRVRDDESEQYPSDALGLLTRLGLTRHYVPRAAGGELERLDHLGAVVRVLSRRDLSVGISHAVSFLGSMSVWLAGDEAQQRALGASVIEGERVSLALTEEAVGSDLLNMTTRAERADGGGYRLHGEKWLVNGVSRNRFALVYARTAAAPGPRSFGLFLMDRALVGDAWQSLPKIPTLGLRCADISAMRFDASLPAQALIGDERGGFETVLKGLQLSRSLCGALSLGALDTGLETALRFALQRPIYNKTVGALPQAQKLFAESWAELLVCESLTGVALRALHAVPQQASVYSAVVKYFVPTLAEQAMQRLAVVYGARYYLRDHYECGIFQKMLRDNMLIGLFDGSTQVNLFSLAQQLRGLATHAGSAEAPAWMQRDTALPGFNWKDGLTVSSGGRDDIFASFSSAWQALHDATPGDAETARAIAALLQRLHAAHAAWLAEVRELPPALLLRGDPQVFEYARRYAVLAAAAAVMADWQRNRGTLSARELPPAVLAVVLQRLCAQLGDATLLPSACYAGAFQALLASLPGLAD